MSDPRRSAFDHARPELPAGLGDQERLVAEAILLVSRGHSLRVTITGLSEGERLLDASRALAVASGVRLIAVPAADKDGGVDVRVAALQLPVEADDRVRAGAESRRVLRALRPGTSASS